MQKKTLDLFGGIGSELAAVMCVLLAMQHRVHESMWKVWIGMAVLLVVNGILMIWNSQHVRHREGA